jgi:rhodanese-related sulfurtransferase
MSIPQITPEQLAERLRSGAELIDVREPSEWEEARIEGATLMPLGTVPENLEAFRAGTTYYVMCRSGGRSMSACQFLADRGITVVNVEGGIMGCMSAGLDVVVGHG